MKSIILAIVSVLCLVINVTAQTKSSKNSGFDFGLYGGINYNFHTPNFLIVSGTGNAAPLSKDIIFNTNNTSLSFHGGFIFNYDLSPRFTLSGRIGIQGLGADLSAKDTKPDTSAGVGTIATTHTFASSIATLEISPTVKINNLFENSQAYLLTGIELGFPISATYQHSEAADIQNASFSNKVYATDINIPEASARYGIIIGAGIPLDFYGYQLTPEISYRKSIINNISSVLSTWNVDQIRIGFAIKLGPNETEPEIILAPKIGIESIGSYEDGGAYKKLDFNGIRVEDIQYTELFPFIPYIFFKANSDKPDETMQYMNAGDARGKFTLEALPQDAIEINKRTLDVIGTRLIDNPEATLMCIGTTDGKTEAKNKGLGLRRAQYAKTYLTSNFGIAADRISAENRNVPENPSALNIEDGMVENRRVDFKSNSSEILQPIMIKGDGTRIAKPEMLEFRPIEVPDSTISSWTLSISQAGRTLREYVGIGSPTAQRWVIRPNELSNSQVPIDYTLTAINTAGGKADTSGSIPVEYRASLMNSIETRADMTVSKFSLILFDFDKSDIPEENIAILKKFVTPAIKGNSKVKIFGYTDKIGPDLYNKTLSTDRANAVRDILQTQIPDAMYEAFGRGEDVPIFDNDIATGRLLSRTVQIYVETPR